MPVPRSFLDAVKAEELELSDRQLELLGLFVDRLLETNRSFNLTAIRDREQAWHKHILESLSLGRFVRDAANVADLGSGAGLPGIPLALLLPETRFALIEATGKKARFIREAASAMGLKNVEVHSERAETLGHVAELRETFDAVVVRAVGRLAELIELGLPLLKISGQLLAVKGMDVEDEAAEADRALAELGGRIKGIGALGVSGRNMVVVVSKLIQTPEKYARLPGKPKKNPLL